MSKGPVSNFTTTSSLPGSPMDANETSGLSLTRFGNFEVLTQPDGSLHLLGGGGFGKTYKARHVYLNQVVALKVINDRFLHDNTAKERFLREAQVVNQLRHPNIAHVLDFGEVKGALYYAMEFCGGGNLENMVNRVGPLSLPTVLRCARQLAHALGCAHSAGFIHRDVKPANVMLTGSDDADPQLKLVDFGLVKNLQQGGSEATAALTMTGQQFFTIQFASPEQLMEEELDPRSDLFALGMTLWFLLKGAPPETGSMASIVAKRLDPRSYEAQLPAGLPVAYRAAISRLLEKDRGQRFQDTAEFLAALAAADAAPDVVPNTAAPPVAAAVPAEPGEPEPGLGSVTTVYDVLENLGATPLGVMYRAARQGSGEPMAITMISDSLREDAAQRALIESHVDRLRTHSHEAIARVFGLEEYSEGLALIQEWHQGVSLHRILKNARHIPYAEALLVLTPVAQGTDWATGQGLPGIVLAMDEIYLQPLDTEAFPEPGKLSETPLRDWPPFRVRLLPSLIREEASQDVGMTLNTDIVSEPTVAFGCLLYTLVAGHAPRNAAKLTKSAYVTIGRLAEDSNRLLASVIVNERDFGGCEGVLRTLNGSEGVAAPAATQSRTGGSAGTSRMPTGPGAPTVDPLKSRVPTSELRTDPTARRTEGGAREPADAGSDTSSKSAVVVKPLGKTGGLNREAARQAEEAKAREDAGARERAEADAEAKARADAESSAKAEEEAQARAEAKARADAEAREKAAADAQARAEEKARSEAEAKLRAEARAKAKAEADAKAAMDAQARAEAKAKAKEEADAKAKADAEARAQARAEADARAKSDAEIKARAKAEADAKAKADADARERAKAEEKARKQELLEEKQAAALAQKQAALLEKQARAEQAAQAKEERQESSRPLPMVPLAIGGALVLVAAGAFAFLHKSSPSPQPSRPSPSAPVAEETAPPIPAVPAVPTVSPPPAALLPKEFVFAQGFSPARARVSLHGQGLSLSAQGPKVMAPLAGAKPGDSLTVELPGWESRSVPITPEATESEPVKLRRQQGQVRLAFNGGSSDYATAVFKALKGLNGEEPFVSMEPDDLARDLSGGTKEISLDTGLYKITLQGPADSKIQPFVLEKNFAVTTHPKPLTLPPSFAGRYAFEFMFQQDAKTDPIRVKRTVVIDPGLVGGHVDDSYPKPGGISAGPSDTRVTDLTLDSSGTLRGLIRFTQRTDGDFGYDEQFELRYTDQGYTMTGGGWEVTPSDPKLARRLKERPNLSTYLVHTAQPAPLSVSKE